MMNRREQTRQVKAGSLLIGGGHPVIIQSMTTTDTGNTEATLSQIKELARAGCELVRVAVPGDNAVAALPQLVKKSPLPIVADIHFNYRLALAALNAGVAKLRINPGNIGGEERLAEIAALAGKKDVPLRVGVNAGSLEKELFKKYGGVTAEGLVESALNHVRLIEKTGFYNLVISLKASSVPLTVQAYRLMAEKIKYPLHIGVTEAGSVFSGTIYSAVGIGTLLLDGLGDTLRVSLTAPPVEEIRVAKEILAAVGLRRFGPRVVSCPTCGRCDIDLIQLAGQVEQLVSGLTEPLTIAVMGCEVNGPGEAREADLGIAGGKKNGLIFCKGEILCKVPQDRLLEDFKKYLFHYLGNKENRGSPSENHCDRPRV